MHSFAITMERTVAKIEDLENRLRQFQEDRQAEADDVQPDFFAEPRKKMKILPKHFRWAGSYAFRWSTLMSKLG